MENKYLYAVHANAAAVRTAETIARNHVFNCATNFTQYFSEAQYARIRATLEPRRTGRNLDIGSGWHPPPLTQSLAVDAAELALRYNTARKKVIFDLEAVAQGEHLPFRDAAFGSATMLSVYQYIQHRAAVLAELQRVLKPQAPLFIVNHTRTAFSEKYAELMHCNPSGAAIARELRTYGYRVAQKRLGSGPSALTLVEVQLS